MKINHKSKIYNLVETKTQSCNFPFVTKVFV